MRRTTPVHCLLALALAAQLHAADALRAAAEMVRASGAAGGVCAVVGAKDADLAVALAKQGPFVVHVLLPDRAACDSARKALRARGMCGTVTADVLKGKRLPYTDNLVNIAVVAAPVPRDEVLRVLAPLGAAYFTAGSGKRVRISKPWPADIDEWPHYLHGPDGNAVAKDRVVGPPRHYQWVSGPLWQRSHETDSSISTLVTARGRLFAIVDEAPISLAGDHPLPDKWFLTAQDAFNGVHLWKVPIRRWGWREWKHSWFNTRPGEVPLNLQKRLVAAGNRLYVTLGYRARVSQLDARTGEILRTYAGTERTNEIIHLQGALVLSVLEGDGTRIVAVDTATGKRLWATKRVYRGSTVDYIKWKAMRGSTKPAKLDPAPNIASDGKVVAFIDGPEIACVDFATGAEKWHTPFPSAEADLRAGGIRTMGNLWVGTTIVAHGVVIHASPNKLAGLDADTGKVLWERPKKYIGHLWYEWKDVFVIDGLAWTWGDDLARGVIGEGTKAKQRSLYPQSLRGYEIRTGKLAKTVDLGPTFKSHHHHRCYRNKATVRYILASRRGTEYVSLEDGPHTIHNWVRGTCHMGMMPANGLQYAPPHPCQCYIDEKLTGMNALAPARAAGDKAPTPDVERGPAAGSLGKGGPDTASATDWPVFRQNAMRTGAVKTKVPTDAALLWRVKAGRRVSAPVVVAGRLYAALVDEHHVVCLDVRNGRTLWEFAAGGRIDSPPSWHAGRVLFGSADGWVYCLRADDGKLAWRLRVAPEERLVGAFGQLESAWPVHGSVLVHGPFVYAAAGRSSQLDGGIRLCKVKLAPTTVMAETRIAGPDYTSDSIKENFQLPMGSLPDILMFDGAHIHMRTKTFDLDLKEQRGSTALQARGGLLESSYFKRIPWTYDGQYARLIVHDSSAAYYVRMFDSLRGLDPKVYFTPGKQGYLLFARSKLGKKGETWQRRIPVRARAMVLAEGGLWVAGPPDVVDPKDPLGAFEGRKGGRLLAVDPATGKTLAEHALPSPPVFHGAAAASARLYLTAEDGSISCFGRK